MAEGDTQIFTAPSTPSVRAAETIEYSHFFKLSIKAFLAVALIATVCLSTVGSILIAIIIAVKFPEVPFKDKMDIIVKLLVIGEPLYTMSGMALAYYFGQQKQTQTGK